MNEPSGIKGRNEMRDEKFELKHGCAKVLFASGGLLFCPIPQVWAQSVSATPEAAAPKDAVASPETAPPAPGTLDQIVVTAQKRKQFAQSAPVAVTAISGDTLVKAGVQSSNEVADLTSGLKISPVFGTGNIPNISIRGVGLNDFSDYNESPSAVYVDEVYKGALASLDFQLFDISRVEVLKGPQGTLFGRNATGGLIHYITKQPTFTPEGFARLSAGSFGDRKVEGAFGGPFSESVAGRLSVMVHQNNGTQQNQNTAPGAQDANQVDLKALRGQLKFEFTDSSSLLLSAETSSNRNKGGNPYRYAPSAAGPDGLSVLSPNPNHAAVVGTGNLNDIRVSPGLFVNSDYDSMTARLNVGLGNKLELISITNGQKFKKRQQQDCDSSTANPFNASGDDQPTGQQFCITRFNSNTRQFSQELRLERDSGDLKWNAGLYYFDLKTDGSQTLSGSVAEFLFGGLPALGSGLQGTTTYDTKTKSWAVFGGAEYKLSDSLAFNGGLRYTDDRKDMDQTRLIGVVGPGGLPVDPATQHSTDTSYLAKLVWNASRDVMLYGGVSTGYKAGTFNTGFGPVNAATYSVKPEKLTSFEIGFKSEFADRTHRINGALFHYNYKDSQAFAFKNLTQTIFNADAVVDGAEVEYSGYWTKALLVSVGVGLLDTKVKNVEDGVGTIRDRKMVLAPKVAANIMARYTMDLANGGNLAFQLDGNYSSSMYFDSLNQPATSTGSTYKLNSRVSWSPDKNWEVAFYVKNMTNQLNKIYAFDLTADLGYVQEVYSAPRTYGLSVTRKF
ncbi:MAG: TonB-dependent receptor [Aquincola sp.]|nr:TonB-dependent receptor [Aquincola sp.]MDH4288457.1 TonB-dependent receptor [Aquincola sp.]